MAKKQTKKRPVGRPKNKRPRIQVQIYADVLTAADGPRLKRAAANGTDISKLDYLSDLVARAVNRPDLSPLPEPED